MITVGDAAILLETSRRAIGNQEKSKQRSTIIIDFKTKELRLCKSTKEDQKTFTCSKVMS